MSDIILEAVRLCVLAVFATLATRSYRRWRRGDGGEAAAWLGASFAVLTVVTVVGIVSADGLGQSQGRWPWKLTGAVLLLFPYCLTRFTASFRPAPKRLLAACGGVTTLVIGWTLAMPGPHLGGRPPFFRAYMLVVLAEWTLFSLLAAGWLWSSARREVSIARRRMRTLSAGSLLVNVALVTRAAALPSAPRGAQLAVQLFALASAGLFFAGFTPPRGLRTLWRQGELAGFHRAQAELITAADAEAVGRVIVAQAVRLFGAKAAFMTAADGRILASDGIDASEAVVLAGGLAPGLVKVPLRGGWLAVQASRATPFFGLDENELLQALCDSAGLALDRAELFTRDRSNREALQQRESQLAQAQRLARLGSWEWEIDTGRVVWSAEMYRIYDLVPTDIDRSVDYGWFHSRSHPDDTGAMEEAVRGAVATGGLFELTHRIIGADGRVKWLHTRGQADFGENGSVTRLRGTAREITADKEHQEQLKAGARQQAALAQLGQRALRGSDVETLFQDATTVVAEVLGVERAEVILDADGVALGSFGPTQTDFLTSVANILAAAVQRQDTEQALAHQALHDPLTGLPNRALLLDRLSQAAARAGRRPTPLAVLFLDLDRFKVVNDGLGHRAGDELLQAVANRLLAVVRPGDTVARLGGDEFVVLCERLAGEDQAAHLAERIAEVLRRPVTVSEREVTITASIGIVVADAGAVAPEALLRDADTAMYQAKERGRARSELFDAPARKRVMERLETEVALRRAVDRGELRLCYQPEVSLEDGRIVGVEALLRWEHPERGLQLPGQFLALAEETGLIVPIGAWALEEACHTANALRGANRHPAPLIMWVNLSGRQLVQPGLPARIARILAETGADPTTLGLEITESVIMEDTRVSGETLRTLKRLGLRIAIDDFGTGFSSLSRLRRFPVDVLKVDRSFVAGIGRDAEDSVIVKAVVGLAHSLGMTAVAEGVESLEQSTALRAMACDVAQGFYFSEPVEAQDLAPLLQAGTLPGPAPGATTPLSLVSK